MTPLQSMTEETDCMFLRLSRCVAFRRKFPTAPFLTFSHINADGNAPEPTATMHPEYLDLSLKLFGRDDWYLLPDYEKQQWRARKTVDGVTVEIPKLETKAAQFIREHSKV